MDINPDDYLTDRERTAMESVMKKLLDKAFNELIEEHPKYKKLFTKHRRKNESK